MLVNYYSLLEISRSATEDQIKAAYRKKAKQYHPDVNQSENALKMFILIKEVYEILMDPLRRLKYDRSIENGKDEDDLEAILIANKAHYRKYGKSKGYASEEQRRAYAARPRVRRVLRYPIIEKLMLSSMVGIGLYRLYTGYLEVMKALEDGTKIDYFGIIWGFYFIVIMCYLYYKLRGNPFVTYKES